MTTTFKQQTQLSEKNPIMTNLSMGFALSVQPISDQTITTDTNELVAGEVKVPVQDGELPAYQALPASGDSFPVVLVVPEVFGVHEHIKDICRRFAKLGYWAIAVELFARQGDTSQLKEIDEIRKVVRQVPDAQVFSDLDATVAWAAASGKGDVKRLGITGFCWGGRIVWLYAAHNPHLKAGVAWYGRLVGEATDLQPKHPVDIAASLKVPVLGLYGEADAGIPVSTVETFREALKAAQGNPSEIIVYPDAPHAFYADYRPNYRPEPAKDGWQRLQNWFKKYGVA